MKNFLISVLVSSVLFISWCYANIATDQTEYIHVAISADYPPFEYNEHGEIKGFDIDLARLIAKKLGKEVIFDSMKFSSILPALSTNQVDVAISTLTITEKRKKNFDFSEPYYFESLAAVFDVKKPIKNAQELNGKRVAVQLGSTMEIWLKDKVPGANLLVVDNNNQAIAALKAGHVDGVVMDGAQGAVFSQKNPGLAYAIVSQSDKGYGLALKKNASLTNQINQALHVLEQNGELAKLKNKWFGVSVWKN